MDRKSSLTPADLNQNFDITLEPQPQPEPVTTCTSISTSTGDQTTTHFDLNIPT